MERIDYLSDDNGDLKIQAGDFVQGDSAFQEIAAITVSPPGDFRQYPTLGFLAARFTNSTPDRKIRFVSELTEQLESDGFKIGSINVNSREWWKTFVIDAQ